MFRRGWFGTLFLSLSLLIGASSASAATTQTARYTVLGDCVDEYDDNQVAYDFYEGEECYVKVQVKPASPARKVALQWYSNSSSKWKIDSEKMTNKNGVAFLGFDAYDSDGYFYDEEYDYRIAVARQGSLKALTSATFYVTFVPSS
jgi:hypothetical protein